MNNCHNCRYMTGGKRGQHRCGVESEEWIDVIDFSLECPNHKPKEDKPIKKSCKNCKFGVPDKKIFDGIRCEGDSGNGCYHKCMGESRNEFNNWEPKQEEAEELKQEKLLTRKEMIIALLDEPRRKAKLEVDIFGGDCGKGDEVCVNKHGFLVWKENNGTFSVICQNDKSRFKIIEPEPEQVEFADAFKAYIDGSKIKSVAMSTIYAIDKYKELTVATDKEIDGKWIILN